MLTDGIKFKNFKHSKKIVRKKFISSINENEIIKSLTKSYEYSYKKKFLKKFYKFSNFRVIGMGGSSLGAQAIYDFLRHKIKKKFDFVSNLQPSFKENKKKYVNLVISKSGNTTETIVNSNILIKKKDKNIFITENKKSYLLDLATKLKSDIIDHNNYIGGRYSVLSEVGMVPAELMGLKPEKFKNFNYLIKNKTFVNSLISNVRSIVEFHNKRKFNSIIINYDQKSQNFFKWYQQLVAESLGKKNKGIMPIISNMPKDNHSVMQFYLDGFKNNFFTFFFVKEINTQKIKKNLILSSHNYLKDKSVSDIIFSQKKASENVFIKKKIPFRSFEIKKRDEKTLGELFSFFILETILVAKYIGVNPYDQPSVELIKKETKKLLV